MSDSKSSGIGGFFKFVMLMIISAVILGAIVWFAAPNFRNEIIRNLNAELNQPQEYVEVPDSTPTPAPAAAPASASAPAPAPESTESVDEQQDATVDDRVREPPTVVRESDRSRRRSSRNSVELVADSQPAQQDSHDRIELADDGLPDCARIIIGCGPGQECSRPRRNTAREALVAATTEIRREICTPTVWRDVKTGEIRLSDGQVVSWTAAHR